MIKNLTQSERFKNYADLMKLVGNQGRYQATMAISFFIISIIVGFSVFGPPFFFHRRQFDCSAIEQDITNCQQYICQYDRQNAQSYMKSSKIYSIADQFGPYNCQSAQKLIYIRSGAYIGFIFSLLFSTISDNFGRKTGILTAWTVAIVGIILNLFAPSIQIVFAGQFLLGMGSTPSYRFAFLFLNEMTENIFRQKVVIIMLLLYSFSLTLIGVAFYYLHNWKTVLIIFLLIPSIIVQLLIIFYIKQTPMFLIRSSQENAVIQLNKIAIINKKQDVITLQHIRSVSKYNKQTEYFKNIKISPFDLFRYRSLRWISIAVLLMTAAKTFLNQGPLAIIQSIGFDIFLNSITFGIIEALAVFVIYFFIQNLPRKKTILYVLGVGAVCYFLMIFISRNQKQKFSTENIIQYFFMLGSRILINIYYSVSQIFVGELYPTRIRSLGFGLVNLAVAFFGFCAQCSIQELRRKNINPMTILFLMMCVGFLATFTLPQTLDKQLQDQIVQIQEEKNATEIQDSSFCQRY